MLNFNHKKLARDVLIARSKRGLSHLELAKVSNLAPRTVFRVEHPEKEDLAKSKTIAKLCQALDLDFEDYILED